MPGRVGQAEGVEVAVLGGNIDLPIGHCRRQDSAAGRVLPQYVAVVVEGIQIAVAGTNINYSVGHCRRGDHAASCGVLPEQSTGVDFHRVEVIVAGAEVRDAIYYCRRGYDETASSECPYGTACAGVDGTDSADDS